LGDPGLELARLAHLGVGFDGGDPRLELSDFLVGFLVRFGLEGTRDRRLLFEGFLVDEAQLLAVWIGWRTIYRFRRCIRKGLGFTAFALLGQLHPERLEHSSSVGVLHQVI